MYDNEESKDSQPVFPQPKKICPDTGDDMVRRIKNMLGDYVSLEDNTQIHSSEHLQPSNSNTSLYKDSDHHTNPDASKNHSETFHISMQHSLTTCIPVQHSKDLRSQNKELRNYENTRLSAHSSGLLHMPTQPVQNSAIQHPESACISVQHTTTIQGPVHKMTSNEVTTQHASEMSLHHHPSVHESKSLNIPLIDCTAVHSSVNKLKSANISSNQQTTPCVTMNQTISSIVSVPTTIESYTIKNKVSSNPSIHLVYENCFQSEPNKKSCQNTVDNLSKHVNSAKENLDCCRDQGDKSYLPEEECIQMTDDCTSKIGNIRRYSLKRQCKERISLLDYNPSLTIRAKRMKGNISSRSKSIDCLEVEKNLLKFQVNIDSMENDSSDAQIEVKTKSKKQSRKKRRKVF